MVTRQELYLWVCSALVSEIYPEIRAIAIKFSESRELLLRYYLDREPTEFDYDSIDMVMSEILANTSSASDITYHKTECIFAEKHMQELDRLDLFVYARREYALDGWE